MKALTIVPHQTNSLSLKEVPEPILEQGDLLCEMRAIGICGTDLEIAGGKYGESPSGIPYLILGHESLGRVLKAPANSSFAPGDFVVGFVRRPDPLPCAHCAVGEWDFCENGNYQERGIKGLHGYASERYALDEKYALKIPPSLQEVGVLLEPTSIVAKAWEECWHMASRSQVPPRMALITGAGPVGLLAALLAKQKNLEVHVLDHSTSAKKAALVQALGGTYHRDFTTLEKMHLNFDFTLECTGAPQLIFQLLKHIRPNGILCLTGVSSGGRNFPTDIGALNLEIVLQNELIFGSVNANRRHYEAAKEALMKADPHWLSQLISKQVPLSRWSEAFKKQPDDIKNILIPG